MGEPIPSTEATAADELEEELVSKESVSSALSSSNSFTSEAAKSLRPDLLLDFFRLVIKNFNLKFDYLRHQIQTILIHRVPELTNFQF